LEEQKIDQGIHQKNAMLAVKNSAAIRWQALPRNELPFTPQYQVFSIFYQYC
jgi:hypothetical protein